MLWHARGNGGGTLPSSVRAHIRFQPAKHPDIASFPRWVAVSFVLLSRLARGKDHQHAVGRGSEPFRISAELTLHHERRPEICLVREDRARERRREDADYGERVPVQINEPAECLWVRIETRLPQLVAHDDYRMRVRRLVVVRCKDPALRGANSKRVKVVPAGDFSADHARVLLRSRTLSRVTDRNGHILDAGQRHKRRRCCRGVPCTACTGASWRPQNPEALDACREPPARFVPDSRPAAV